VVIILGIVDTIEWYRKAQVSPPEKQVQNQPAQQPK
jgi:hypothetical protein